MSSARQSVLTSCEGSILVTIAESKDTVLERSIMVGDNIVVERIPGKMVRVVVEFSGEPTARQSATVGSLNSCYATSARENQHMWLPYSQEAVEEMVRRVINEVSNGEPVKIFREVEKDDWTLEYTDITAAPPVADTETEVD